ncbi:hypothetical protein N7471_012081 [Penicillium samsonianum]|uniref:uncharacterized protein n=1 Tax=Penicillium samsonianum TaxID=1882272 RepID=UPI0025488A28|nr:uncharacterized protein N7471_012081 [Penicillium samsonianum]KAJ6124764.1 hypothetical protein N7471_012081 [Penicillium samsonianum]
MFFERYPGLRPTPHPQRYYYGDRRAFGHGWHLRPEWYLTDFEEYYDDYSRLISKITHTCAISRECVFPENSLMLMITGFPTALPAGLEGHRYELLALISWVGLFWGTYDTTRPNFEGFIKNWVLPHSALAQLAERISNLCRSFLLLAQTHINTHGLHPRCSVIS